MTARLRVVEALTDPGAADRPNEDAYGANDAAIFVIDGATGLADAPILAPESGPTDAAWLAGLAAGRLEAGLTPDVDLTRLIGAICTEARDVFHAAPGGGDAPRYAWPSAAIQILRLTSDGAVETAGLGDCRLFLVGADGALRSASGPQLDRAREQAAARAALARSGGFAARATLRDPETLAQLREARARQNTEGGYWTLGLAPEAAERMAVTRLNPALPARGLLLTDGFADLAELYGAYTPEELVAAAFSDGLAPLCAALRRIEREDDPSGARYPRFKQSDDATGVLFTLA